MTIDFNEILTTINKGFLKYYKNKDRILILYGGAGSGKSYYIAQKIILRILLEKNHRILVIRKIGTTRKDSVYQQFLDVINSWNLSSVFEAFKSDFTFKCASTNSEIICIGLDDVEKLKSVTRVTSIWVEEATELTEKDFDQINLRLRGKTEYYKQIILSFNPIHQLHWLKRRFLDVLQRNCSIFKSTYKDNEFIDDEYKNQLEAYKDIDTFFYQVYCLGEWGVLGNLVFSNWEVQDLTEIKDTFNSYRNGLDWGFNNPFAVTKNAKREKNIYILDELYMREKTNDQTAVVVKELIGNSYITCDSAEPKSIKDYRNLGIKALKAKKGKDSVIHGIKWLKQHRIIISNKCINTINEFQMYKWRVDKEGNVLDHDPVDLYNHAIDSLRYAFEDDINRNMFKSSGISASELGL